ncbi:MAG: B12-binding domain-containing protein [Acidimicrobiia bacterium]
MAERIDLQEAARRLGVHYQTAYRWVREGRLTAVRVRGRYELAVEDVEAFARERDQPAPASVRPGRREWGRSSARLLRALLDGDERTATELVNRLHAQGEAAIDVLGRVVVPALAGIGDRWAAGELSVAHEHRASEIVSRLLAGIDHARPGRPRGAVVVAAPPGELHGIPVEMAAAVLREDGWSVQMLGRDMPADALLDFVEALAPDLVVLTFTTPDRADAAEEVARRLTASRHDVLVGEPGRTLTQLVEAARTVRAEQRRLLAGRPRDEPQ